MWLMNGCGDCACTITIGHDSALNILEPNGGHKQMGILYEYEDEDTENPLSVGQE